MTVQQQQAIEQALERARREGIRIIGKGHFTGHQAGQRFWLVSSKNYEHTNRAYIVTLGADHQLHCNCQARGICKHRAVVHGVLKAEIEARIVRPPVPTDAPAHPNTRKWDDGEKWVYLDYEPTLGGLPPDEDALPLTKAERDQAIKRERALPAWATDDREFSIFKPEREDYIPRDYYQHAYR